MERKLIFLNLALDQLLDREKSLRNIFQVDIPESIKLARLSEDFGYFIGKKNDTVLLANQPNTDHQAYLEQFSDDWPKAIPLDTQAYETEKWSEEVNFKLKDWAYSKIEYCAVSELEKQLHQNSRLKIAYSTDTLVHLNNKMWLLNFVDRHDIPFPKSEVMSHAELKNLPAEFSKNKIVKFAFSSGGGGIFDLEKNLNRQILSRATMPENSRWILQDKCTIKKNYSVFGSTNESSINVCCVNYDEHLLSNSHHLVDLQRLPKSVSDIFALLQLELQNSNYKGPFGFDAFETINGIFYPIVDLNVRMTKTHLIFACAQKFNLASWNFRRLRLRGKKLSNFNHWWSFICTELQLNSKGKKSEDEFFYPVLLGGFLGENSDKKDSLLEISYFQPLENTLWSEKIAATLKKCVEEEYAY